MTWTDEEIGTLLVAFAWLAAAGAFKWVKRKYFGEDDDMAGDDDEDDVEVINDGGPAFPVPDERGPQGEGLVQGSPGMTLRDYFAAKALPQIFHAAEGDDDYDTIATNAYQMADSMLRARKGD